MKVFELFSRRQRRLRGESVDVYTYDHVPQPLRVQLGYILRDAIGKNLNRYRHVRDIYEAIYQTLCREYGVRQLAGIDEYDWWDKRLFDYLLTCPVERVLDVVDLAFRFVDGPVRAHHFHEGKLAEVSADDAMEELNYRFREHSVGYQFEGGQLVRMDSELLHSEVVKPTVRLLSDKAYAGPNEEFLKAHEHYRKGDYEECLSWCLKSFESTMKVICAKQRWAYDRQRDTAKRLIEICFEEELIPVFLQSEFGALRSVLESGVPTARNRAAGHGRGSAPRQIPGYFAGYVLHMTATTILFLVEAELSLQSR